MVPPPARYAQPTALRIRCPRHAPVCREAGGSELEVVVDGQRRVVAEALRHVDLLSSGERGKARVSAKVSAFIHAIISTDLVCTSWAIAGTSPLASYLTAAN